MDATHVSDRLFGRPCRLPIAAWIAQHPKGRFYQSEAPKFPRASSSNVVQELARLVELGMLDREEPDDSRRVYYVRTDSELWQIVRLASAVVGLDLRTGQAVETDDQLRRPHQPDYRSM